MKIRLSRKKENEHHKKATNIKTLKYGGYSVIITVIVIAAIIALNIIASVAEDKGGIKADLTKNKAYTLDKLTIESLKNLNKDLLIYTFQPSGSEEPLIINLLELYAAKSEHIKIRHVDPVKSPSVMTQFNNSAKELKTYSVVVTVEGQEKAKYYAINPSEMTETNENTNKTYFVLQQKLTSAILYMNTDILPNVYFLSGHGEPTTTTEATAFMNRISMENYNVTTLDLKMNSTTLRKGDILVILNPTTDLSNEERVLITDFLENHGKALFFFSPNRSGDSNHLNNFKAVLGNYLIKINDDIVMENDPSRYISGNNFMLRPVLTTNEITNPLRTNNISVYMNEACSINYNGVGKADYTFDRLLVSTDKSYAIPTSEYFNEQYKDKLKANAYAAGANTVAAAFTKVDNNTTVTDNETRIMIFGSYDPAIGSDASYIGDVNMIRNSINWVAGKEDQLYIAGVDMSKDYLDIKSSATVTWIAVILLGVIPLILVACGVTVWLRRKNR